jgi:hypothetical protein
LERVSEAAIQAWREHLDAGSAAASQASFAKGLEHRSWLEWVASNTANTVESEVRRNGQEAHIYLLHDIFGNPFRPVLIEPKWLTPIVTSLAAAAYEERSLPSGELDLARLAVLADALEEAGLREQPILDHLRSPGPHVRGCWPLDLILGRA